MVTYVALLMLLQLGLAPAEATFCSALLFLPWALKSFMRPWVARVGNLRLLLHIIEALLFVSLFLLAISLNTSFPHFFIFSFPVLFVISLLSALHELTARIYYERAVSPASRLLLTFPRHVFSQATVVVTYGALIFLVGMLQVYFRQIRYSWAVGCMVAAGLFLLFALLHFQTLPKSNGQQTSASPSTKEKTFHFSLFTFHWIILFLLLLPQSLMFFARVLYLYGSHEEGGLQCTMQEIGFAQGTVGVISFSIGIALCRRLIRRYTLRRLFWPMALCIVLSPVVYFCMTVWPPQTLMTLCLCTLTAQLLFGLGLGACRLPLYVISGTRYRDTINMLQIPLVSAAMILPMALSGSLVELWGYDVFFLVNALTAPVCLLGICLLRRKAAL